MKLRKIISIFGFTLVFCLIFPIYCNPQWFPYEKEPRLKWSQDKEKTWIELDEPIPEGPKHKKWPWLPGEKFPFKPPYTGDELAWFINRDGQVFARYIDTAFLSMRLNKRGHLIQRCACQRYMQANNWQESMDYEKVKAGQVYNLQLHMYLDPPEKRCFAILTKKYQENPEVTKYPDIWIYSPSLRRNRRVGISDRADCVAGSDFTWDDQIIRWPWESTHTIIGTDVLYESAGKKVGVDAADKYPWNPYRDDGGMECYVVKEVHENPKYYLSQRIIWYERTTKLMLRDEQYDRKGNLLRVLETGYLVEFGEAREWFSPEHHRRGGIVRSDHNAWTVDIDHRTWAPFNPDDIYFAEPFPENIFNPSQLFKEEQWRERASVALLKSPKEFIPRPPLYREKFPKYRKFELPEEVAKKIRGEILK